MPAGSGRQYAAVHRHSTRALQQDLLHFCVFRAFQFAHGYLVRHAFLALCLTDLFCVLPALDTPPDQDPCSDAESGCISRVPAPGDARDIVRFSVRPVHCHEKIRDLSSERGLPVDRLLAYVPVQEDLVRLRIIRELLHETDFSDNTDRTRRFFVPSWRL